jgi:hypothetical protein
MLSSNMLLPILIPLIDVTFSTPTPDNNTQGERPEIKVTILKRKWNTQFWEWEASEVWSAPRWHRWGKMSLY